MAPGAGSRSRTWRLGSTGSLTRRAWLARISGTSLLVLLAPRGAKATDYASAAAALSAMERLASEVRERLGRLASSSPRARSLVSSFVADHEGHVLHRALARRRLRLAPASVPSRTAPADASLDALRTAQQQLVFAYAEGLPALGDPGCVEILGGDLVDLSRHLAVLDLWIELEGSRG
jgi:hypothetical protein